MATGKHPLTPPNKPLKQAHDVSVTVASAAQQAVEAVGRASSRPEPPPSRPW
jgi:hypothetical protein